VCSSPGPSPHISAVTSSGLTGIAAWGEDECGGKGDHKRVEEGRQQPLVTPRPQAEHNVYQH